MCLSGPKWKSCLWVQFRVCGCDNFDIQHFNCNCCCGDRFVNTRSGVSDVVAGGAGVCDGVGGRREQRGRKRSILLCNYLFITYFPI